MFSFILNSFDFVLKINAKSIDSSGQLTASDANVVVYKVHVDRTDGKKNGKLSFTVNSLLTGDGSFKSNNGKGDGNFLVSLINIDRKLKAVSTFTLAAPTYDINTEFYYDFEKDDKKKITFDTKNKVSKNKLESSNILDIENDKYKLDVNINGDDTVSDGKRSATIGLTLPTNRQIIGEFTRDFHSKVNVVNGRFFGKISDKLQNQKQRSISYDLIISNADFQSKIFNILDKMEYIDFEGKNALLTAEFKHLPKGHFKTGAATVTIKGTLLPEIMDLVLSVDEYCTEHMIYHASAKYGSQVNVNINGNYYVESGEKPASYEFQSITSIPNTDIKQFKFQSSGKLLRPATVDALYEAEIKISSSLNDKHIGLDTTVKGNGKHGSGTFKLNVPEVDPISVDTSYNLVTNEEDTTKQGTLEVRYGNGHTVKVSGDVKTIGFNEITVNGILQTPFDNIKNVEVSYKLTV